MRDRLWYELGQVKHNHFYCVFLLSLQRRLLNYFNMTILAFSSAGIMGWTIWKEIPLVACIIVATISLLKLLSPHIVPSEKQIDKLDQVTDFYFDYFNKLEIIWFDHFNYRLTDEQAQAKFYKLKDTERDINKTVNEIVKSTNSKIYQKADTETRNYLQRTFNT
jgi:predicted metallo-beta-lactamase superfamily hydrolase